MMEPPTCPWCDRRFRPRRTGGRAQKFCRPLCRQAFHAAARAWALRAIAIGAVPVADMRNGAAATCALLPGATSTAAVPQAPPRHCERHGPAEEILVLPDELGALLGDILDALSPEELGRLPEPIWALLDFIAGTDVTDAPL
jgi:hypothetical protein